MSVLLVLVLAGALGLWLILAARGYRQMLATLHRRDRDLTTARDIQAHLAEKVMELEAALDSVRVLRGLLPICSYCKRIRNDQNDWERVEAYVTSRTDARFTHGICPTCLDAAKAEFVK